MAMASSSAELKSEIEMHIRYLKACQKIKLFAQRKITSQKTEEVLDRLSDLFCTFDTDSYIHMVKEGLDQTVLELWQALMTFRKTLFRYFGKNKRESQGYQNLLSLLSVWWNLANGCREFGDELVASGVVPIVLEAIDDDDDINRSILGLLHNCIRMSHQNRDAFRNANAIPVLKRCLKSTNKCIQVHALMILAYIVNENEREILATSERGLRLLLNAFKHATSTEDHKVETMAIEWSGFELLDAINHLAINDTNKAEIEKQGAIPAIIRMLHDDISSDEERRVAADTLWNLSFDESIRESEILQNAIPRGDILIAMAKAVKKSDVILLCMSERYQESRSCRSGPITPQKQETTCSGPAMSSPNPAAAAWTDEEVQDWLRKKKLNCPTLEAFDGSDLQELYVQLQKDDNAFKHELKTGFHMDSPTSVRFTSALRKLFAE